MTNIQLITLIHEERVRAGLHRTAMARALSEARQAQPSGPAIGTRLLRFLGRLRPLQRFGNGKFVEVNS